MKPFHSTNERAEEFKQRLLALLAEFDVELVVVETYEFGTGTGSIRAYGGDGFYLNLGSFVDGTEKSS